MRAITVRNPWATFIALGLKTAEARGWRTRHRGPILIVSSVEPWIEPAGCAVAVAEVKDVLPFRAEHGPRAMVPPGRFGFVWLLENVRAVKPVPVRGRPGIYESGLRLRDLEFVRPERPPEFRRVRVELAREGLGRDGVTRTRPDVAALGARLGTVRRLPGGGLAVEAVLNVPEPFADLVAERWREPLPSPTNGT